MEIHTRVQLKNFTTMKIGGSARFMVDARTPEDVINAVKNSKKTKLPFYVIGGGSNLIATDEGFSGLIIRMRIPGFQVVGEDSNTVTIKVGAGENWDETVKKTVDMNLSGLEALSGIPGTVGAAPVQNIGAYGQEVSDTIDYLEAYDIEQDKIVALASSICEFAYRDSIFKSEFPGRFIILSVAFKLYRSLPQPPFYDSLQEYLDKNSIKIFTVNTLREAVLKIRAEKLPDPKTLPNTGSFFKNAIIEDWQLENAKLLDPNIPSYDMGGRLYKVPAGWLIEQAGLKGQLLHGMRVYDKNALVLVNESATSYQDLLDAKDEIVTAIRDKFSITLEQEPLVIPS